MANSIAFKKNYAGILDKVYQCEATSACLNSDPTMVRAGRGAREIMVPRISVTGLGNYERNVGYKTGSINYEWETKTFNYDRGIRLFADAMDIEETGIEDAFVQAGGELQRVQVAPEADAFTFAQIAGHKDVASTTTDFSDAEAGDVLLVVADAKNDVVFAALGALRLSVGEKCGLIDKNKYNFLWVTEFPLLEWSEEENRFMAAHHPFTMPMEEDWHLIDSDPGAVRAKAYDIVLNGTELGGGSVRIHQDDVQEKMLEVLGFTKERAHEQFGFLLNAFKYGVPPHAGLAFGLDRMIMLMVQCDSLRDVIAFPKVKDASCLMTEAPGEVEKKQLEELALTVQPQEETEEAAP